MPGKTLVLGIMPTGATPASHLAAGPWCFAGREKLFPGWEREFTFAPEPLANPDLLPMASRAAQTLCARIIPLVASAICVEHASFKPGYWQTLLCPWCIDVARQLVERNLRCLAMIRVWGNMALTVPLLPENMVFNFQDEQDFTLRGSLGDVFNHWLFSRLLEARWPQAWQKSWQPTPPAFPLRTLRKHGWKDQIRHALWHFPFPPLKGMTLLQAARYSRAINHPCHGKDHTLDLSAFDFPADLHQAGLPPDTLPFFLKALPDSIKKLRHKPPAQKMSSPRTRVASVSAYENAAYRQELARWRERGGRLAYAQHGGNYGQVKVACDVEMVEYSQDVFFTWGWKSHGSARGNFLPMPYPQLAKEANAWNPAAEAKMIFVGAEMAAYGYRLESRPTPLQFLAYRSAKLEFFREIGTELSRLCQYRPYFPVPGCLEDADWLLPQIPGLTLCEGPLFPRLVQCRLLILDHHGTTLLEAMAANIPFVAYWNTAQWPLDPDADGLRQMLEKCGIWHPTPIAAARKVKEICGNTGSWWQGEPIQKARLEFCRQQARLPDGNLDRKWISTLETL